MHHPISSFLQGPGAQEVPDSTHWINIRVHGVGTNISGLLTWISKLFTEGVAVSRPSAKALMKVPGIQGQLQLGIFRGTFMPPKRWT